ncbi:MAG: tripartite tricarboxylate transporter substrate binding protein [Betaproteobacteria bacterium]|nr:tripartite tricarboxylate transporter substrate binding protein [Betaproteobacteria bacterium]
MNPNAMKRLICLLVATLAAQGAALAQTFPSKSIRFIAAFPAGGPSDIVSRAVGKRMSEVLGQPVVIENRAGAGGNIGAEVVAKSAPDGYTVLLGGSYLTIAPSLYLKLPYDPEKDFAPIGLIVSNQYVLVTHPAVPARNVKELIRLAKSKPGQLNYGSAGIGSPPHLAGELLKTMAGINAGHIPYKGATPALVDLIGGHIDYYFGGISGALPHVKTGKIRALAVTSSRRSSQLPEVPTVAESALPGYDITTWFGLLAAAGTPRDIVKKLNGVIVSIVNEPELKNYLIGQGVEPVTNTPEQFSVYIRSEISKFAKIVKAAGIKPE